MKKYRLPITNRPYALFKVMGVYIGLIKLALSLLNKRLNDVPCSVQGRQAMFKTVVQEAAPRLRRCRCSSE